MNRFVLAVATLIYAGHALALVDLNSANQDMLEELNGIGPAKARAIVEYRQQHGPFTSLEQLLEVHGIGPGTLERLRPQLVIGSETPQVPRPPKRSKGPPWAEQRYFGDTPPH